MRPASKRETERLLLRAWRQSDLDDLARVCADPEVMRHIGPAGGPRKSGVTSMIHAITRDEWEPNAAA